MPDLYSIVAIGLAAMALALGAGIFGVAGLIAVVAALLAASALWGFVRARRVVSSTLRDPRFERTEEIFLDHRTGKVMRVYADPRTGERRYLRD
jgi:hypothetical protein